jgi:chaperone required for assembly of F1-ATPase
VIDAVADAMEPVADEVVQYLGADLLCYRAEAPDGLVESQTRHWDPVLAWARDTLGARFVLGQGVVHVAQPDETIAALRATIPAEPWRLGALSVITTLTGSGLLALALERGAIEPEAAWAAAHVDEDWQIAQWGRDDDALERRAYRRAEFEAATTVLRLTK